MGRKDKRGGKGKKRGKSKTGSETGQTEERFASGWNSCGCGQKAANGARPSAEASL